MYVPCNIMYTDKSLTDQDSLATYSYMYIHDNTHTNDTEYNYVYIYDMVTQTSPKIFSTV